MNIRIAQSHILELWDEEIINAEKIITGKYATYAAAKKFEP